MKEFALKHPILTFLLADSAIAGIVNIVCHGLVAFGKNKPSTAMFKITQTKNHSDDSNEEEIKNEPACDIQ